MEEIEKGEISFVGDIDEMNRFMKIMPEAGPNEAYFISLSGRAKYLTDVEREEITLGRQEMFGRETASSKEFLMSHSMRALDSHLIARRTKNDKKIPHSCLVCYMNINPSNMVNAYLLFQNEMNREIRGMVLALQNGKEPNYEYIQIQQRKLMNCIQRTSNKKYFIDIDCDTKDEIATGFLKNNMDNAGIEYHIIESKNGFHFMIRKETLKGLKFNLKELCDKTSKLVKGDPEVMINGNAMVPVPGTYGGGFLVKFIK
jgi:hypothetical protein